MKKILEEMLLEMQKYKRNKEDLLPMYIQKRINKQVQSYYKQILENYNILQHQNDEPNTIKKIVKNLV